MITKANLSRQQLGCVMSKDGNEVASRVGGKEPVQADDDRMHPKSHQKIESSC